MTADEDEAFRQHPLHIAGEIDDLRNVGEIVQREADCARLKILQLAVEGLVIENLEIENPDLVSSGAHRRRHPLHPKGFQAQIDLAVHEGARMDEKDAHNSSRDSDD